MKDVAESRMGAVQGYRENLRMQTSCGRCTYCSEGNKKSAQCHDFGAVALLLPRDYKFASGLKKKFGKCENYRRAMQRCTPRCLAVTFTVHHNRYLLNFEMS